MPYTKDLFLSEEVFFICAVIVAATYFPRFASSIIGATAFHFRVRNETGWAHCA